MTRPDFAGDWQVIASTSRFFPVHATVELRRKPPALALAVRWEEDHLLPLFEKEFPEDPPGTFRGSFGHPKYPEKPLDISVTVSLGPLGRKYMFGVVREPRRGIDPGGTGVWVAEEPPKPASEE